jgi:thioredoxin-like negative regulator of GroEL
MFASAKDMPVVSDKDYTHKSGLTWHSSLDKGMQEAANMNKPMLVYFWAPWCKVCGDLEKETYADAEVNRILKNDFVLIAINIDDQPGAVQRFGVTAPPEIFIGSEGRMIKIIGYVDADSLLTALTQVKTVHAGK